MERKRSIEEVLHWVEELRNAGQAANEAAAHFLSAVEKHQPVVESRERQLDRTEITVEAILKDVRRHREQRPSQ